MPKWHDRAEWLRYSPSGMTGPSQDRSAVRGIAIHHTGGNFDVNGDFERQLAAMNESYWRSRGYALGYNWGVDPGNGDVYPIRGSDIRCAANGCQAVNVPYVTVLAPTATIGSQPTEATKLSVKNFVIPELRKIYPQAQVQILGHRDIKPICGTGGTACPGEPHYALIRQGYYNSADAPTPTPTEDDDMAITIEMDGKVWVTDGVKRREVTGAGSIKFQRALSQPGVFKVFDLINVNTGTSVEQADKRAWATQIPVVDPTADDAAMAAIAAAVSKAALTTHLQEVEDKVDKIPTTPSGGPGGPVSGTISGEITITPTA